MTTIQLIDADAFLNAYNTLTEIDGEISQESILNQIEYQKSEQEYNQLCDEFWGKGVEVEVKESIKETEKAVNVYATVRVRGRSATATFWIPKSVIVSKTVQHDGNSNFFVKTGWGYKMLNEVHASLTSKRKY